MSAPTVPRPTVEPRSTGSHSAGVAFDNDGQHPVPSLEQMIKDTYRLGLSDGRSAGYVPAYKDGWYWGVICGVCAGAVFASLVFALRAWLDTL